jgi:hypothetical protein
MVKNMDTELLKGIGVILLIPLLWLLIVTGLYIGSSYLQTTFSHKPISAFCDELKPGIYTIFPPIESIIYFRSPYALYYGSIPACINNPVSPLSLVPWYLELLPIGIIAEILRQRVTQ